MHALDAATCALSCHAVLSGLPVVEKEKFDKLAGLVKKIVGAMGEIVEGVWL